VRILASDSSFRPSTCWPRLTALDNIALPLLYGALIVSKTPAGEALERVGLALRSSTIPTNCRAANGSAIAIARALVTNPALILATSRPATWTVRPGEIMQLWWSCLSTAHDLMVTHDSKVAQYPGGSCICKMEPFSNDFMNTLRTAFNGIFSNC